MPARNTDSTIKRFAGDPRLAAALLPLAQTILGGLLSRLALGGIAQGARAVRLSDGSIIRVVTNSGIHVVEIDCRAASAPSARSVVFALHPHSDTAPNGWWFPTEEATGREAMEGYYYPRHSYYSDEGVDTNFWWETYHRPHASLTVNAQEQRCMLAMDRDIWFGNQTVYSKSGGAVWSWWHSPHGDAPLVYRSDDPNWYLRTRHTPYLAGGLQVVVHYDPPDLATATITPCVFRNSQLVWSYSDDDIGDFDNEITADDSAIIGGVYPVTADRILVVVLTNAARTATLWDVTVHPPDLSEKTSVWTATVGNENTAAMRWPWRFHPDGTECSTIVAYTKDSPSGGGLKYTEYKIWTLSLSYDVEAGTFSASKAESEAYYLRHVGDIASESSGLSGTYGTMTSSSSVDWAVDATHAEIPLACNYGPDGELVVAWLNVAGTTITSGGNSTSTSAAPGNYNSTSNTDATTTTSISIIIGSTSYAVSAIETTTSSSYNSEILYAGDTTASIDSTLVTSGRNKRVIYLDVLTKSLVLYANDNESNGSSSESAVWVGGGGYSATVSGSTTIQNIDSLWYLDTPLFSRTTESVVNAVGSGLSQPYPYLGPSSPSSNSSTSYTYVEYPDQSQLSIDMGFGMAIDQKGEFFILSYDCLERDVNLGGEITTLDRQAGNYSNAPHLASALTFEGENKLLFPLGIGVVGSL